MEVESLAEIKRLEAEAQLKRQRAEAKKMLVSDNMVEWLGQHRLQECAADLARIAGAYAHKCEAWLSRADLIVGLCVQDRAAERPAVPDRRGRRRDR